MQDKGKFAVSILITIFATAMILRVINFYTKTAVVEIEKKIFKVEVMKNAEEQASGLSGRESLKENRGMLFVFPEEDYYQFWMKGMKFSIDIIWINRGKIVDIKEKTPIPATNYLESYRPEAPAKYVLEIGAGLTEKYGFKVGDAVKIEL